MTALRQRIRIRYTKTGDLAWISHHDLMRLWERLLRRSGLPVAFSEGFNPRPKLSVPLALNLGVSSQDEVVEIELARWSTAAEISRSLADVLPAGMEIRSTELLAPGKRGQVRAVEYEVELRPEEIDAVGERLAALPGRDRLEIVRQRTGKPLDLKPYVESARLEGDKLVFSFRVTPQGTARPEELCALLGLDLGTVPVRVAKRRTELEPDEPPRPAGGGGVRRPFPRRGGGAGRSIRR